MQKIVTRIGGTWILSIIMTIMCAFSVSAKSAGAASATSVVQNQKVTTSSKPSRLLKPMATAEADPDDMYQNLNIFLIGDQTSPNYLTDGWDFENFENKGNYLFEYMGKDQTDTYYTYKLTVPEGLSGEWLIYIPYGVNEDFENEWHDTEDNDDNLGYFFAPHTSFGFNAEYYLMNSIYPDQGDENINNNFRLQSVRATEIWFSLHPDCFELDPAEPTTVGRSKITVTSTDNSRLAEIIRPKFAGDQNGWGNSEGEILPFLNDPSRDTENTRNFYITLPYGITGQWKIRGDANDWSDLNIGAGASQPELNTDYTPQFKNQYSPAGTSEPGNIFVLTKTGEPATIRLTVTYNGDPAQPLSYTLKIEGQGFEYPEYLNIIGDVDGHNWEPTHGVTVTGSNGIYQFKNVVLKNNEEGQTKAHFRLTTNVPETSDPMPWANLGTQYGSYVAEGFDLGDGHIATGMQDVTTLRPETGSDEPFTVYFIKPGDWEELRAHYWSSSTGTSWPGEEMTNDSGDLWKIELPAGTTKVIFNNNDKGKQTGDLDAVPEQTYNSGGAVTTEAMTVHFVKPDEWQEVHIHYWNNANETNNGWPGPEIDPVDGIYTCTIPAGQNGIIFNKGEGGYGNQTGNIFPKADHTYSLSGDITDTLDSEIHIYWDNASKGWTTPHIHYWNSTSNTDWPGVEMSLATDGTGRWEYTLPAGTTGILFTDGAQEGTQQTGDMTPVEGHTYCASGDRGILNNDPFTAYTYVIDEGTYDITVNLMNGRMAISKAPIGENKYPAKLYLIGNANGTGSAPSNPAETAVYDPENPGIYTFPDLEFNSADGAISFGYFSIATLKGSEGEGWDGVNLGDRYGAVGNETNDNYIPRNNLDEHQNFVTVDLKKYEAIYNAGATSGFSITPAVYTIIVDMTGETPQMMVAFQRSTSETPARPAIPNNIYMIGNVNGTNWSSTMGVRGERNNGVFRFRNVTINPSANNYGYFNFATRLQASTIAGDYWYNVNLGTRYGAVTDGSIITTADEEHYIVNEFTPEYAKDCNAWGIAPGVYDFEIDFNGSQTYPDQAVLRVFKSSADHDTFEYTERWFSEEQYIWVDENNVEHISYLNEPATNPRQMLAFIGAIYGNRKIPGIKEVRYMDGSELKSYNDLPQAKEEYSVNNPDPTIPYPAMPQLGLNDADYTPDEHGITAILVEMNIPDELAHPRFRYKDPNNPKNNIFINKNKLTKMPEYIDKYYIPYREADENLASYYETVNGEGETVRVNIGYMDSNANEDGTWPFLHKLGNDECIFKSMQVLTERTFFDTGNNPGYLFNVEKTLKHYFIVLKGKPRKKTYTGHQETYEDIFNYFEQVSPTNNNVNNEAQPASNVIDELRKGAKYQVVHDCSTVFLQDHYFCMDRQDAQYDEETHLILNETASEKYPKAAGDYEARENVYIYIPEARMMDWTAEDQAVKDLVKENPAVLVSSYGRDYSAQSFANSSNLSDIKKGGYAGAFTYYNPVHAPYIFLYSIKLDVNGYRPMNEDGNDLDHNHFNVELEWQSNLTTITGTLNENTPEEYYIYPVIDGMIGAPLKASDLASFKSDSDNTTITVAAAGDMAGALLVTSYDAVPKITLTYDYSDNEMSKTVTYVVAGRLAGKQFEPVFSNEDDCKMDGQQFVLSARVHNEVTTSRTNLKTTSIPGAKEVSKNTYTHVIQLFHDKATEDNLLRKDINCTVNYESDMDNAMDKGTTFYLIRRRGDDKTTDTPIAYAKVVKNWGWKAEGGAGTNFWAYYWAWAPMPGHSEVEMHRQSKTQHLWQHAEGNFYDPATNKLFCQQYSGEEGMKKYPCWIWSKRTPNEGNNNTNGTTYSTADQYEIVYPFGYVYHESSEEGYSASGIYAASGELMTGTNVEDMIYLEFRDTHEDDLQHLPDSYTYYYVYDREGSMYNVKTGLPKDPDFSLANLSPRNKTNEVQVTIPKSVLNCEIASYTLEEILQDQKDHHLNPNSSNIEISLLNNRNIKAFDIYRVPKNGAKSGIESGVRIATAKRTHDGSYESYTVDHNDKETLHSVTGSYDLTGRTTVSIPVIGENMVYNVEDRYYGVITTVDQTDHDGKTFTRQYGIDLTPGIDLPELKIIDPEVCLVESPKLPASHRAGIIRIIPDMSAADYKYDSDIQYISVWRTLNVDKSLHPDGGVENLMGTFNVDKGMQGTDPDVWKKDFSTFKFFTGDQIEYESKENGKINVYEYRDGFILNEDSPSVASPVIYHARAYAEITAKSGDESKPSLKSRKTYSTRANEAAPAAYEPRYIIAFNSENASYNGGTTGVDETVMNVGIDCSVKNLGNCRLQITGEGCIEVLNFSGMKIKHIDDGVTTRTIEMPSEGYYIVAFPGKAVKVLVK